MKSPLSDQRAFFDERSVWSAGLRDHNGRTQFDSTISNTQSAEGRHSSRPGPEPLLAPLFSVAKRAHAMRPYIF